MCAVLALLQGEQADQHGQRDRYHVEARKAGSDTFRPSIAESTEIAGVITLSP